MGDPTMVKKVTKKPAGAPGKSAKAASFPNNMIAKKPRTFSIGGDIQPKRDLTRFVRWPKYVRLQRAKMTLLKRIKIPPAINQFANSFDKKQASALFRLLNTLKPESKADKKARLAAAAAKKAAGGEVESRKPYFLKYGINHVTTLVEEQKAKLVVMAHDVDPIEVIVWLPALCKARGVPYCIVKSKARLGALVGKKTATCVAVTDVKQESKNDLANLITLANAHFMDVYEDAQRKWGDAQPSGRQLASMAKLNARK